MNYLTDYENQYFRLLSIIDLDRAVFVQSRAFANDPFWVYLIPNPGKRAKCWRSSLVFSLRLAFAMGTKGKAVLYLDKDLVKKSKNLGFNLSKTFENQLKHLPQSEVRSK